MVMVRLIDIADHLGLSRITVSAVLNNRYKTMGISEATAKRVLTAARELGYRRNQLALAIKTGKTNSFGIIIGGASLLDWMGQTLKGGFDTVRETNYVIKVDFASNSAERSAALDRFLGQRIEGLFCFNIHAPVEEAIAFRKAIENYRIPMITSDCTPELSVCKVVPDHEGATMIAVEHLVNLGHRRIAFVGGDTISESGIGRKEGFLNALERFELSMGPGHLKQPGWGLQANETAAKAVLSSKKRPTAIVCASDITALVVVRLARRMGMRVPEDLSIIGYSNETAAELSDPPLTVVDMHHGSVGRKALALLVKAAEKEAPDRKLKRGTTVIPSNLILRESTAAPRKN